MKKFAQILLAVLLLVSIFVGCKPYIEEFAPTEPHIPTPEEIAYYEAWDLISDGRLGDARLKLLECIDYKDARQIFVRFAYKAGDEISKKEYRHSDGSVVINDYRYEYEYDQHGNVTLALGYADGTTLAVKYVYQYDNQGRATRQDLYTADDVMWKSYVNEYDSYGNLTAKSIIDHTSGINSFYNEYIYTYDDNGLILEKVHKNPEFNYISKIEYWTYDDRGNKATYKATDGNGIGLANNTFVYIYDELNRIKQVTERNALGTMVESYTYEYNDDGQVIKETYNDGDGTEVIEYNAFNKIKEKRCYDTMGGLYIRDVNEYDEYGNVLTKIRYRTGEKMDYKYEYTYDQYGLLILEVRYDGEGNVEDRYEYQYDDVKLYYNPFA